MQSVETAITATYFLLGHQGLAIAAPHCVNDLRSLADAQAHVYRCPRPVRSTASSVNFHLHIVRRPSSPSAVT